MLPVFLLVSAVLSAPLPDQDPGLRRAAWSAARTYESLLRRTAPLGRAGVGTGECDEVIGRFCFHFGSDEGVTEAPEDARVAGARRRAIEAHRRWLSAVPGDADAAGPLIRYLIEDGRAREAVSVARTHVWAAGGSESLLLLGLALHESGDVVAAETAFDSARAVASARERGALDDVRVLLAPGERDWYAELDPADRNAYHRRLWAFSDPSRLQAGNERRSAHYARHAWCRILDGAPRAAGTISWGRDRAEIVLRYGLPYRRERVPTRAYRLAHDAMVVSYYDPRAVALVPEALHTAGMATLPPPGVRAPLERDTVRSSYAPGGARRVRGLTGQVVRLPTNDSGRWRLRVAALLAGDTASPALPRVRREVDVLLSVLDTLGREVTRATGRVVPRSDNGFEVHAEAVVPPGQYVYQLEVVDDSAGLVGLGRYRVDVHAEDVRLSDPLLAAAGDDGARSPLPSLVFPVDQSVRVHAEVGGLTRRGTARYAVEWALEPVEQPSGLGRAVRWLGRALGLAEPDPPARLRWEATADGVDPVAIAFEVDLSDAAPGRYRLRLTVRDQLSGREATSYRAVLLEPPAG